MTQSISQSDNSIYITTPIYYVNDKPHIGSAYTTLACDTLARYHRLAGKNVYFLTGTDEHGQKVQIAAEKANMAPKDFVDFVSQSFSHLVEHMDISNDDFIRTTQDRHYAAAKALWNRLMEKGFIYLGAYEGWYAVRDEAFYSKDELVDGKAPTGADVEWLREPSYFFKLSAFQDALLEHYKAHPDFIAPSSRRNEVLRFVEGGLNDLSVSRTTFTWGVPVPNDENHIMYVWLDALTNYITALGYPDTESHLFNTFWKNAVHVVGKDILRFHAVFWPAFLMAADLPLPKQIFAHGWWTNEGVKISKSLGNTIDPIELIDTFGIDAVRYFLLREVPFGQDGDFSRQALINRLNSDLANAYGNLVQRVLSFIHKNSNQCVPQPLAFSEAECELLNSPKAYLDTVDIMQIHKYIEGIWALISKGNQYMDENKPWALKTTDVEKMNHILYVLCDYIRQIAILTQPFVPVASEKILNQLSVPVTERSFLNLTNSLKPGTQLPQPVGVFPRYIENAKSE
jgi:methionyl-tRNA synthetase